MKKRSKSTKKKERKRKPHKEGTPDEIIAQADSSMESLDLTNALSLYKTATNMLQGRLDLKLDDNESRTETIVKLAKVQGKLGEAKVSLGDPDGARQDFAAAISLLNSITLNEDSLDAAQLHETRATLHLFFGQLSSNEEALDAYKSGVQRLEACVTIREAMSEERTQKGDNEQMVIESEDDQNNALFETRKQVCGAYCSLAELYLTDLCFAENAEVECETYLQSALKVTDPVDGQPLVDALQTLASLRLSQNRGIEAVEHILAVYEKMKTGCEALAALVGLGRAGDTDRAGHAVELVEVEAADNLPGFEFRLQSSKILLECASALEVSDEQAEPTNGRTHHQQERCVLASIQVLGSLIAENDEVVEIWYLLGCSFVALTPPNAEVACQYWEKAKEMLLKVKECLDEEVSETGATNDSEAGQQLQNVLGQLEEVSQMLNRYGNDTDAMDEV